MSVSENIMDLFLEDEIPPSGSGSRLGSAVVIIAGTNMTTYELTDP